jgi:hypothetical protein
MWAMGVAHDREVLDLIGGLRGVKRQPNLVFAAARHLGAPEGAYAPFRSWLVEHWANVVAVVGSRSTQTNEAGRCAVLLPMLSRVDGEVALIEAGASAGLTLYPDRYSYRYDTAGTVVELDPPGGRSEVVIPCTIDKASVPTRLPHVVWRAGVDLNPINVSDPRERGWLEALIWPEHDARRERLRTAAALAAADPPHLVKGDILDEIPRLIRAAPPGARAVVFHSAVLNYIPQARREEFADLMSSFPDVMWISNEGAGVLPSIAEQVNVDVGGRTIIAVDGAAVALAGPHGQSYQAL